MKKATFTVGDTEMDVVVDMFTREVQRLLGARDMIHTMDVEKDEYLRKAVVLSGVKQQILESAS